MTSLRSTLLALTVALCTVPATFAEPTATNVDAAYAAGTKAMNESRWTDAVAAFDQVVEAKDRRAGAALYWKAYSLGKLNKAELALETCSRLHALYPTSSWNRDCTALRLSNADWRRADGSGDASHFHFDFDSDNSNSRSKDPDTDLKMLALNSLIHRDPAQAMPILRDILTGNQSPDLKQHALFVLAQSHSPDAAALMHDLILGKQSPALQRQAIQASGIYLGRRANDTLLEAYRTTADPQVKRAVISALFLSQDDTHMVELARAEKNIELKRSIVSQLSLMQGKAATDYMLELLK